MKKRGNKKQIANVAAIKCGSYNQKKVDKSINKLLNLIKFKPKKSSKVLLKPNLVTLGTDKSKHIATITHPSIIIALCKFLKKYNCKIYIGESSFMDTDCVFKKSGIDKIAHKYGKLVIFEQDKLKTIKDSKAKVLKSFPVSKTLTQMDYIINLPKMKTHVLTNATLGIKNLYGLIPGGLKQRIHSKAKGDKFSQILVDIYQNFPSELTIMDAIIGMEGQGPTSGNPKKTNLILASQNTVALDIATAQVMDFKPKEIPAIKFAIKRKLYPNYKFNLLGLKQLPIIHYRRPMAKTIASKLRKIFAEKPIICNQQKCTKCQTCKRHCPVKAISMQPFPIINKKKCIRCFCCIEVCPEDALSLKQ